MSDDVAETFTTNVVDLVSRHAREPALLGRLREVPHRKLLVAVYEFDAALVWTSVQGHRVRLPDPDRTRGQRVFCFVVEVGDGQFVATRVDRSRIPEDLSGVLYLSVPCLAALVRGSVESPAGPVPYDGLRAFQSAHLDFCGVESAEAFSLLETLNESIARVRAELTAGARVGGSADHATPAVAQPQSERSGPLATIPQDAEWK